MKNMIQVYCNDEVGVNAFLKKYKNDIEVINIQMTLNESGEYIMVAYETLDGKELDFTN
jgi:hypothetical protein